MRTACTDSAAAGRYPGDDDGGAGDGARTRQPPRRRREGEVRNHSGGCAQRQSRLGQRSRVHAHVLRRRKRRERRARDVRLQDPGVRQRVVPRIPRRQGRGVCHAGEDAGEDPTSRRGCVSSRSRAPVHDASPDLAPAPFSPRPNPTPTPTPRSPSIFPPTTRDSQACCSGRAPRSCGGACSGGTSSPLVCTLRRWCTLRLVRRRTARSGGSTRRRLAWSS